MLPYDVVGYHQENDYSCYYQLPGKDPEYRDWEKWGHGTVDRQKAIVESSDVYTGFPMKSIKNSIGTVVLFAVMMAANIGSAEETVVFSQTSYPPFFDDHGEGVAKDLLIDLFQQLGYSITIDTYPWKRAIENVNTGEYPAIIAVDGSTDPQTTETMSPPIFSTAVVLFYNRQKYPDGIEFTTLSDLQQYTFGMLRGISWKPLFDEYGLEYEEVASDVQNFKKVMFNRIDLFGMFDTAGIALIKQMFSQHQDVFGYTKPFELHAISITFSTQHPLGKQLIHDYKAKIGNIDVPALVRKHLAPIYEGHVPDYVITGHN